jgi:hypothetical protein
MSLLETVSVHCPYCGELIELVVDPADWEQQYVEDCEVCCHPMEIRVGAGRRGSPDVEVRRAED